MRAPHSDRVRVGGQAFRIRKAFDGLCNSLQTWRRQLLDRDDLHKIQNAQASAKTCLAASWKHVTGTRSIIARGLRRVVANEDRAGIPNKRYVIFFDRDVLRREKIGPLPRLLARVGKQD